MRQSTRILLATTLTASLVAALAPSPASAQFTTDEQKCRSAIAKGGSKYAKSTTKAVSGCQKNRDKGSVVEATDCNDLTQADSAGKLPAADSKFESGVTGKCVSGTPADVLFIDCPAPCNATVPDITTFAHVGQCLSCLVEDVTEGWGDDAYGSPDVPLGDAENSCHAAINKNASKLFNSVLKTLTKCQASEEKAGSESVTLCTDTNADSLTQAAYDSAVTAIQEACTGVTFPNAALDPCGGEITAFALAACVAETSRDDAKELVGFLTNLPATVVTTTTSTTTTLPGDPACPDQGELTLYSGTTDIACTTNADCLEGHATCDTGLGVCTTVAELSTGWTGQGHGGDVNGDATTMGRLHCAGGPGAPCGVCDVVGIDPTPGNCRCNNDVRTICDEPFRADADDCGGSTCNCYFGTPFPLTSGGTPVCVVNRFFEDISGTADVDAGSGEISANLRSTVFLGPLVANPCPTCGGTCSTTTSTTCNFDSDCPMGETCTLDTPDDGVRGGVCIGGQHDTLSCDATATNTSFPSKPGESGGLYSLDCQPLLGAGIGTLKILLNQTTGTATLGSNVDCDGAGAGTEMCHCLMCSTDRTQPCAGDSDCTGGTCQLYPNIFGTKISCNANADCGSVNLGNCTRAGGTRCQAAPDKVCTTNADCQGVDAGDCEPSTCTDLGNSYAAQPESNQCDTVCVDTGEIGDGVGECDPPVCVLGSNDGNPCASDFDCPGGTCDGGPVTSFCQGVVKADGSGIYSCTTNADCDAGAIGVDALPCGAPETRPCFLPTISATGTADPEYPVGVSTFCVGPTDNEGINDIAGLPGPGRVVNQAKARTFCSSDHNVQYTPGVGGCP